MFGFGGNHGLGQAHPAGRVGLLPEELLEAGILSNPETPAGAYKRARGLVEHGAYKSARAILTPHFRTADADYLPKIAELLGVCAVHAGGNWEELLGVALHYHREAGDQRAAARVLSHLGEGHLLTGKLDDADKCLRRASDLYGKAGEVALAALAQSARARVRLRSGNLKQALRLVDAALDELKPLGASREEGLVRLVRARVLSYLGTAEACAKEILAAERLLACSGSKADRLATAIVRGETLITLGEGRKAYAGLRRLLVEAVELEDVPTRAWVHGMLGRAAMAESLPEARRHLMRAKHLYGGIGSDLGEAECDLWLAQVELRLGFAVHSRLHGLGYLPGHEWRLFAAELKIARGECIAENNPDLARRMIFEARAFGIESGNRTVVRSADLALRSRSLVTGDAALAVFEDEKTLPSAYGGVTFTAGHVPPGGLQPFEDDTFTDSRAARRLSGLARGWDRFSGRPGKTSPGYGLTPPTGGVKVA